MFMCARVRIKHLKWAFGTPGSKSGMEEFVLALQVQTAPAYPLIISVI